MSNIGSVILHDTEKRVNRNDHVYLVMRGTHPHSIWNNIDQAIEAYVFLRDELRNACSKHQAGMMTTVTGQMPYRNTEGEWCPIGPQVDRREFRLIDPMQRITITDEEEFAESGDMDYARRDTRHLKYVTVNGKQFSYDSRWAI
jgi:hypothetical protein